MINIYRGGFSRVKSETDGYIEFSYLDDGLIDLKCEDGFVTTSSLCLGMFFANVSSKRSIRAESAIKAENRKVQAFDTLSQTSMRHDYLNSFDTFGNLPKLSTGKFEQPCHHEKVSGTLSIMPTSKDVPWSSNALFPGFFYFNNPKKVYDDYTWKRRYTASGVCLYRAQTSSTFNPSTGISTEHRYWSPNYWVTADNHIYKWPRKYTEDQARENGTLIDTHIIADPFHIWVTDYPSIDTADAQCYPYNHYFRVYLYGESIYGVTAARFAASLYFAEFVNPPDMDYLVDKLSKDIISSLVEPRLKFSNMVNEAASFSNNIWYELVLHAGKELDKLDMNNIANALEIPGMIRTFDEVFKKFIHFKDGKKVFVDPLNKGLLKRAACVYLGIHYGIKLTVMDYKTMYHKFKTSPSFLRQINRRFVSYSHVQVGTATHSVKLCMRPRIGREVMNLVDRVDALGLAPSLTNAWDLLPWSFVVDWFVPIGDFLDSFENYSRLGATYDLEYLIETVSFKTDIKIGDQTLQYSAYDRYITDQMPMFGFDIGNVSGLNNHVIEASALVVNCVD